MQSAKARNTADAHGISTAGQPKSAALLAGLVFDASGERLAPHFSVKRGKRYHYYVSAGLVRGSKSCKPIRVPATDLNRLVTDALSQHLLDPVWVLTQFPTIDEAATVQRIFAAARELGERIKLSASDADTRKPINTIAGRVVVGDGIVTIDVCQTSLRQLLNSADPSLSHITPTHDDATGDIAVSNTVQAKLLRCGKQVKLIVGEVETTKPSTNQELISIISEARRWFEDLKSGRYRTIAEIADKEERQVSDVSRSISFAFLAPDIVQTILDGRQPITLTPERLKASRPLPLDWTEQRRVLLSTS